MKMDSEGLHNLGNEIIANAETFDGLITKFQKAYESITADGTWKGSDADNFRQVSDTLRNDLLRASEIVNELGKDLVGTADDYDQTHEGVTNEIGSML